MSRYPGIENLGFDNAKRLQTEAEQTGVDVAELQLYRDPMDIVGFLENSENLPPEVEDYWHGYLKAWD